LALIPLVGFTEGVLFGDTTPIRPEPNYIGH